VKDFSSLCSFIRRALSVPCHSTAEDLAQEVYLSLLKAGLPFDGPLLRKTARLRVKSYRRAASRKKRDARRTVRLFDVAAPRKETIDLDSLPPDLRQVVDLRMMGYTADEMAKMLSLPVPTVNCRLRKAKGILRGGQPRTSRYRT
jgi:DNA-directed RNA polymerase specialized sigma24 family protein